MPAEEEDADGCVSDIVFQFKDGLLTVVLALL